jgi:hypothetical protein
MRAKKRLVDMDPADRQIAFMKIGLYSGSFLSVVLILIAMASQQKVLLGLLIAGIFLVVTLPLDYWLLKTARKKQRSRRWDPTNSRATYSRRN